MKIAIRSYFLVGKDKTILWSAKGELLKNDAVISEIKKALNIE